jgi:hypothetical protein
MDMPMFLEAIQKYKSSPWCSPRQKCMIDQVIRTLKKNVCSEAGLSRYSMSAAWWAA